MQDVRNINELRDSINKHLCTDEGMRRGFRPDIAKLLFRILDKERIKLDKINKIQTLLESEKKRGEIKSESLLKDLKMDEEKESKPRIEEDDEFDVEMPQKD